MPRSTLPAADAAWQQQLHSLYRDHHGWLFAWLRRKLGNGHDAADVAQDAFLRILGSRDLLVGTREPRAYLVTTAKRLMIDQARRALLEQAYLDELAQMAAHVRFTPSPEEIVQAVQALAQIEAVLDGLSARARQAFLLHYLEGDTHTTVAAKLGVSTKSVQKYLIQALAHCQRDLDI